MALGVDSFPAIFGSVAVCLIGAGLLSARLMNRPDHWGDAVSGKVSAMVLIALVGGMVVMGYLLASGSP
jgi:hypothetical protein